MLESSFIFRGTEQRPSCHCASITDLPGGGLLATWYAGSREGAGDVAVMGATRHGDHWGEPRVLWDPPGRPGGNTVVFRQGETIWHFVDVIEGRGWNSAVLYLMNSDDGGASWSEPRIFDEEPGMMVRHRPVRLSDGRILLPAYDEKTWRGFAYITDDGGDSWCRSGWMSASSGAIQPAIIERADGGLHALLRSDRHASHAWECSSDDEGESWSECRASSLLNPNSGVDMISTTGGETIACFNDTHSGRTPLTLALSHDGGQTWSHRRDIESAAGEYSYPTLMDDSDGTAHLVYTWQRERIRWIRFEAGWIADL